MLPSWADAHLQLPGQSWWQASSSRRTQLAGKPEQNRVKNQIRAHYILRLLCKYLALLVNVWVVDLCAERHLQGTYFTHAQMQMYLIFRLENIHWEGFFLSHLGWFEGVFCRENNVYQESSLEMKNKPQFLSFSECRCDKFLRSWPCCMEQNREPTSPATPTGWTRPPKQSQT